MGRMGRRSGPSVFKIYFGRKKIIEIIIILYYIKFRYKNFT